MNVYIVMRREAWLEEPYPHVFRVFLNEADAIKCRDEYAAINKEFEYWILCKIAESDYQSIL